MRAVIYARYSTDLQNAASIDDQVRLCRERIERDGHELVQVYSDRAVSGASLIRPGIQSLMQEATRGKFDLVYAEALDRISRDQEDVAGFFKRMRFAGVTILTLAEGEISELHVGLKGTMNALFLKDLADKTRRGLRGRVETGRSGGAIPTATMSCATCAPMGWSKPVSGGSILPRQGSSSVFSTSTRTASHRERSPRD